MNKNITEFDYNKIYNEEIAPLFNELKSRCQQYGIPFFSVCCTSNKDGVTEYKNTGLLDGALDINLYDENFLNFLQFVQALMSLPQVMKEICQKQKPIILMTLH